MALKNTIEKIGWVVVILLVFVGLISIVGRLYVVVGTMLDVSFIESDPTSFDGRYNANPILTLSHLVPGFLFMLLGPFQFIKNVRAKWIQLHRWSGRVFIVSSLIAGVAALVVTVRLPVFGNLSAMWVLRYSEQYFCSHYSRPTFIFENVKLRSTANG